MIHIKDHKTPDMFDPFPFLGPKRKQRIEESWAKIFREHILPTLLVEKVFSKYDPAMGAPTKELYAMLGLMVIQQKVMDFGIDRFVLSKGHACWPYYVLLRERGLSPKLEGHPKRDPHNGVWCTTGSLGHGLPSGVGMALAKKLKGEGGRVYVLMGDGECQAGTTWESMLIAARLKLDNLVAIVDWNGIQGSDFVADVLPITGQKMHRMAWELGWCAREVDGHDVGEVEEALKATIMATLCMIVANTVKGKGVSFMEPRARRFESHFRAGMTNKNKNMP